MRLQRDFYRLRRDVFSVGSLHQILYSIHYIKISILIDTPCISCSEIPIRSKNFRCFLWIFVVFLHHPVILHQNLIFFSYFYFNPWQWNSHTSVNEIHSWIRCNRSTSLRQSISHNYRHSYGSEKL